MQEQMTHSALEGIYDRVSCWVQEMFGEMVTTSDDNYHLAILIGSKITFVEVLPFVTDEARIAIYSYVVMDIGLRPDLLHFLLQEAGAGSIGAFCINAANDIVYSHTIIGSSCDKYELRTSILVVSSKADAYGDKIRELWGGTEYLEQ